VTHRLGWGDSRDHARELMREFEKLGRLDYRATESEADHRLSFDELFAGGRCHMFGVLECVDARGSTVVLRAFSSLRGGIRDIEGWVSPILSAESFYGIVQPGLERIDAMTRELDGLSRLPDAPDSRRVRELTGDRTSASQQLWRQMEDLYVFHNFRGESRSLKDAFFPNSGRNPAAPAGIPAGVGECCAPKLLNHAAQNALRPVGLAEFYWGGSNPSGAKRPGDFYPCCATRCQPILGFMLCGLDDDH
jgi:hypothetical protein